MRQQFVFGLVGLCAVSTAASALAVFNFESNAATAPTYGPFPGAYTSLVASDAGVESSFGSFASTFGACGSGTDGGCESEVCGVSALGEAPASGREAGWLGSASSSSRSAARWAPTRSR